ncbi:MAG: tyrosine-type recombinase/integrase [Pseudomonadota bacterium]
MHGVGHQIDGLQRGFRRIGSIDPFPYRRDHGYPRCVDQDPLHPLINLTLLACDIRLSRRVGKYAAIRSQHITGRNTPRPGCHDLRHTLASRLRQNDVPASVLRELVGFKSATMVRHYARRLAAGTDLRT